MPKDSKTTRGLNLRFGEYLIDSGARRLSRGDKDVKLSPKAFDLLCELLAQRPDVVSKNELMSAIWPDTYVVEANLNVVIAEIRKGLGDDRQAPRFIRTVHGVGYAFCGQASPTADTDVGAESRCWLLWKERPFALVYGQNIIGRDPRSEVWLDDESVSRRHARITVDADGARVEDLASTNGTYLNRALLESMTALRDGDLIDVGSLQLTFRTMSDAAGRTKRLRK